MANNKKSYIVFLDGKHEYDITSKTYNSGLIKHTIKYSHRDIWADSLKGKKIVTIIEGDLKMEIHGINGVQDYDVIYAMQLLLSFITRDYKEEKVKIVRDKNLMK